MKNDVSKSSRFELQKALLLIIQFLFRRQTKKRRIKRITHRSRLYQDHSYIDRKMFFLISSFFISRRKCRLILVCKLFVRCVDLLLSLRLRVFFLVIWVSFEKLVVINYLVVSKEMFRLIDRHRRRNNWPLRILLRSNLKRLKGWQRDEVRSKTLAGVLIVINWSMIFSDQETIINWKKNVCRRVDLASTLVTLITSLVVVFGVHMLLFLHRS